MEPLIHVEKNSFFFVIKMLCHLYSAGILWYCRTSYRTWTTLWNFYKNSSIEVAQWSSIVGILPFVYSSPLHLCGSSLCRKIEYFRMGNDSSLRSVTNKRVGAAIVSFQSGDQMIASLCNFLFLPDEGFRWSFHFWSLNFAHYSLFHCISRFYSINKSQSECFYQHQLKGSIICSSIL